MRRRSFTFPVGFAWVIFLIVAVEIVVTYSRVPPHELYHVSGHGIAAGFGRALVFLNFPTALAVLPPAVLAAEALREKRVALGAGVAAVMLCAIVFWPGVVNQGDLDAKPLNALPALGVVLAVALAARARLFVLLARLDVVAAMLLVLLFLLALPWMAAELGFYLDRVPVLGSIFLTGKLVAGHPAVHHGHHHGIDGVLLVVAALATVPALRRAHARAVAAVVTAYLGLELAYGLANVANDAWGEQVVKRGWTDVMIPNVLRPTVSLAWFGIVVATPIFATVLWRRALRPRI